MSKPAKSTSPALFDITPDKQPTAEPDRVRSIAYHVTADEGASHLDIILHEYANGCERREEVAHNITAKYRKVLKANGPNYDGPLYADIVQALIAAEEHGKWKATKF